MKRFFLISTLLIACYGLSIGQTSSDSITMKKVFGGYQYSKANVTLTMNQLVSVMKPNEEAYKQIKSAQSNYVLATIISGAGGAFIGYPIGTAIGGGEPNWLLAGIGAGLVVISIPITQKVNEQAKQAVDIYNRGLQNTSFWYDKEIMLSASGNGIGFVLRF